MRTRAMRRRARPGLWAVSIPTLLALLAFAAAPAAAASEERPAWKEWLDERFSVHGFLVSNMYVRSPNLDLSDEAIAALWKDFELGDRDWSYLKTDEWFESLRDDPEFQNILDEMRGAAEG